MPFDLSTAVPVGFNRKTAYPLHEGMTHEPFTPPDNPVGEAIVKWGKGVKERSTPEGFAKALTEQMKAPPAELAMNWVSPLGGMVGATAWHGSPHLFDKFKSEAIGTGEGAQAYGHGLYLAEKKQIGQNYKEALAGREQAKLEQDPTYWESRAAMLPKALSATEYNQLNSLSMRMTKEGSLPAEDMQIWRDLRNRKMDYENKVDELKPKVEGHLYKADIPDAHIDKMLDWDKPLSEQSQHVQAALINSKNKHIKNMVEYANTPYSFDPSETKTMGEAFKSMSMNFTRKASADSAKASKLLANEGIPGIKYLDGSSRTAGEGTRNFVMFNPEDIRILERNGQPTGQVPWSNGDGQAMSVDKNPWEMTKAEYEATAPLKPQQSFYIDTGAKNKIEVVRNPTDSDIQAMRKEAIDAYGKPSNGDPVLRSTEDANGNSYYFKSNDAVHAWIEPQLSKLEGVEINQNASQKLSHAGMLRRALYEGQPIPESILKDYPTLADEVRGIAGNKVLPKFDINTAQPVLE